MNKNQDSHKVKVSGDDPSESKPSVRDQLCEEPYRPDECDQCSSTDVEYPYTTMGYLCTNCRSNYLGHYKNVH